MCPVDYGRFIIRKSYPCCIVFVRSVTYVVTLTMSKLTSISPKLIIIPNKTGYVDYFCWPDFKTDELTINNNVFIGNVNTKINNSWPVLSKGFLSQNKSR